MNDYTEMNITHSVVLRVILIMMLQKLCNKNIFYYVAEIVLRV